MVLKFVPIVSNQHLSITQHNDTQINDILHKNELNATISIMIFSRMAALLPWVSFMLNVANNPFMLSVVMLNIVMLSDVAPYVRVNHQ